MFYLDDRNKFGLISSFIYFVVTFISQIFFFINNVRGVTYSLGYSSTPILTFLIVPAIALFVVISLAKDFFKDKSVITLLIGLLLFIGFSLAPIFRYFRQFGISAFFALVGIVGCILLMSIRLIKSPNIGKFVGFIGILFIIAYLVDFIGVYFGNVYIDSLWSAVLSVIPSGIFFSYFLFYEKS